MNSRINRLNYANVVAFFLALLLYLSSRYNWIQNYLSETEIAGEKKLMSIR